MHSDSTVPIHRSAPERGQDNGGSVAVPHRLEAGAELRAAVPQEILDGDARIAPFGRHVAGA